LTCHNSYGDAVEWLTGEDNMMPPLKPGIALETVKGEKTMAQIASEFMGGPIKSSNGASIFWRCFPIFSLTVTRDLRKTVMSLMLSFTGRLASLR